MEQLEVQGEEDELEALETGRLQSDALASDAGAKLASEAAHCEEELRHMNIRR